MAISLELDKSDLIAMVRGRNPGYDLLENPLVKRCGYFTGGFAEKWTWQSEKLELMTEKELSTLYFMLKEFGF